MVVEDSEEGLPRVRNVVAPTLTPVLPLPGAATGAAAIVAPGGGFQMLEWGPEGLGPATWLAERGIACFVLRYRLEDTGPTPADFSRAMSTWMERLLDGGGLRQLSDPSVLAPEIVPLAIADGEQSVRQLRRHADDWSIDPHRIGFVGFSAGAFVAVATATSADANARPDLVAPIYGGHLSGAVPDDAPPLFAVVAADDPITFDTTVDTFRAWREAGRPAELHAYSAGGHGFGTRTQGLPTDGWMTLLGDWMRQHGFLPA